MQLQTIAKYMLKSAIAIRAAPRAPGRLAGRFSLMAEPAMDIRGTAVPESRAWA